MSSPHDDEQTDLVWREIVANYGERVDPDPHEGAPLPELEHENATYDEPAEPDVDLADEVPEVERFRPPPAPPVPFPRTWQRAVAWAGVTVVPVVALLLALTKVYVPSPFGWLLVLWAVGGFVYLAVIAPRTPREPWDDGSRV